MRLGLITILLCFAYSAIGQGTNEPVTFGGNTYNMIVYKPAEYADSIVKRYPAIIFFVGAGEVGTDAGKAYEDISFEREAYENEGNNDYLKTRKFYSWVNYL